MKYYYVDAQNKTVGPVTGEALQELIKTGTLKADPMVIIEGGSEWRPLSAFAAAPNAGASQPSAVPNSASLAADRAMAASKDALAAFKMFAANPVGALRQAFENLGPQRALGAGVAFGVVFALSCLLAAYRLKTSMLGGYPLPSSFYFKAVVMAIIPFAALVGVNYAIRMIFKVSGGWGHDCFLAGASLLPEAFLALVGLIVGGGGSSFSIMFLVGVFAVSLTVLILFTGYTQIYQLTVRNATFLVPGAIAVVVIVDKIVGGILFQNGPM